MANGNSITAKSIADAIIDLHRGYGWRAEREALFSPRRIDVLAIGPGGGSVIAYEVKVSRADFCNELKDPSKRGAVMANSTEFYFVTPTDLIQPEEVPEGCGLIYYEGGWLVQFVDAPAKRGESVFDRKIREEQERLESERLEDEWYEHSRSTHDPTGELEQVNLDSWAPRWLRNWMFPTKPLAWPKHYLEAFAEISTGWVAAPSEFDFDQVPF